MTILARIAAALCAWPLLIFLFYRYRRHLGRYQSYNRAILAVPVGLIVAIAFGDTAAGYDALGQGSFILWLGFYILFYSPYLAMLLWAISAAVSRGRRPNVRPNV